MRDYANDPSERILAAEQRRRMRSLLDASSFGTPGAQALRKLGERALLGDDQPLTAAEQAAVDVEMADLEEAIRGAR